MNTELICNIVSKTDKNFELALVPAETLKKFVEEIVREGMAVADKTQLVNRQLAVSVALKEHFGVK